MKNIIAILSFICLIAVSSNVQAQNDNSREGKAIAAFRQSCGYAGAVETQSQVTGICFVEGFTSEVLIVANLNCQQVNCDLVRIALLARVQFDCDGNVTSVECL